MTYPFPPHLQFTHPWRKYQQKILDETDLLFSQRKFHLVAPPGSGKTILGLELMLRINRKTLILAPTIVIREQWIERLLSDFGVETNCDWDQPGIAKTCFAHGLYLSSTASGLEKPIPNSLSNCKPSRLKPSL